MGCVRIAFAPSVCLVALALVAGGAACDSTLNLGNAGDGSADGAGVADAAPPTCASTCNRLVADCRLIEPEKTSQCLSECNATGRPADLECVARTACSSITRVCGDGRDSSSPGADGSAASSFEITSCQTSCDAAGFFDCLTPTELTTCRDLCASAPAVPRNNFTSCARGGGSNCPKVQACLQIFVGD
ncbi:hypothetical protein BH11MYX4_BH11MYX4_55240 [soil metagenome]